MPNPEFGLASDSTHDLIWIYYMSGNGLVQVHMSGLDATGDGIWEPAISLKASNADAGADNNTSPSPSTPAASEPKGASTGGDLPGPTKAGIIAGMIAGSIVAFFALTTASYALGQQIRAKKTSDGSDHPTDAHELGDEPKARQEMPGGNLSHEMEQPDVAHEMDDRREAESVEVFEMPGDTVLETKGSDLD
ncbi:Uu.00g050380.m01.CDS01 [Anthostomella pinea]|uniref:Uu.00g050380.m01.CDS01 n=1 Tax=Anthostomella pinea TaxID=933095 RepID=A0AAI8VSM5_9PEZI|nr:Uu.00g050380.m01.CDS01 [Anthostomella pinea]